MKERKSLLSDGWAAAQGLISGRRRYFRAIWTAVEISTLYARRSVKSDKAVLSQTHTDAAQKLVVLCQRNGAVWVKAAQFFSCRPDVLPKEYILELQQLQNDARAMSFLSLVPVLEQALGPGWREHFKWIEPQPVATASIAQVHKAQLNDGTEVALKIRLPHVKKRFKQDVIVFRLLARLFAPLFPALDFVQINEQLVEMTEQELDFCVEAENLANFSILPHTPGISTPKLVKELSSESLLVTSWVDGERLRNYLDEHPEEAQALLSRLFMSYLQQVTRLGIYQADPHPGNFLVNKDGEITILDYGAIGQLTEEQVKSYSRLLYGLMGFHGEVDVGQLFVDAGFIGGKPDTLRELSMYVLSDRLNKMNPATAMIDLLDKFRENHVHIPDSYIGIARVLITLGGFLMHYNVPFDWTPPEQR